MKTHWIIISSGSQKKNSIVHTIQLTVTCFCCKIKFPHYSYVWLWLRDVHIKVFSFIPPSLLFEFIVKFQEIAFSVFLINCRHFWEYQRAFVALPVWVLISKCEDSWHTNILKSQFFCVVIKLKYYFLQFTDIICIIMSSMASILNYKSYVTEIVPV